MRKFLLLTTMISGLALGGGLTSHGPALAQDGEFTPEKITVEPGVGPGPHVFLAGRSSIHVLDPGSLDYLGQISAGSATQFSVTGDGKSVIVSTSFTERNWTGPRESFVQVFDGTTLEKKAEWPIPAKNAMSRARRPLSALSAEERWFFVQNATPATSVTVADMANQKTVAELPIPGCWGIYPVPSDAQRFTTICGNGTFATYTLTADGSDAEAAVSDKIFDVDDDPLFIDAVVDGDTLAFVSYNGNVYRVDVSGEKPRLIEKFSMVAGIDGDWKPTGFELTAYDADADVLYVLMRSKGYDGSHKEAAEEIWAVDVASRAILSRTTSEPVTGISFSGGAEPVLYAYNGDSDELIRYEIGRAPTYALRRDKVLEELRGLPRMEIR